jgi:hypothetical protein
MIYDLRFVSDVEERGLARVRSDKDLRFRALMTFWICFMLNTRSFIGD